MVCQSKSARATLLSILLVMLISSTALAAIYVKCDSPGPILDGTSWETAFHTVQEGIDAASSGGEVWVARGTYVETIILKAGVALYGGYSGEGDTRSIAAYTTILDGNGEDSVVTSPVGATVSTRIDGFTIRNGLSGVYCYYSSPSITNNTIARNNADNGGGVFCENASPIISNNIIVANSAYYGSAIYCWVASPTITNNTIVGNSASYQGGALSTYAAFRGTVSNNIVAFNSSGMCCWGGTPTLRNNCVYGNAGHDYLDMSTGTGDISVDPLFAGKQYGNYHLQPGSPCANSGWDSAPGLGSTDMDGQPRVQPAAGTVDIGADESDGTTWPSGPYVTVRVSPSGNDANDGSSWSLAKKTVQAAIDLATIRGGEVWAKAGTYNECIILRPYAYLYGGFAGMESSRTERDWRTDKTVLDGSAHDGPVITIRGGHQVNIIDGFTIQNGASGGIYCSYASPDITNNLITENIDSGIYCGYSVPIITGNVISGNAGGGITCSWSFSPVISNNVISGNDGHSSGGGIYCYFSAPAITNNTITGNNASEAGGGIFCYAAIPTVSDNVVAFNSSGIHNAGGDPVLRNNCVYGNTNCDYSDVSAGTGDISLDPLFVNQASGDYHLSSDSPCVDAGWNEAPGLSLPDMDGENRVMNTLVDIGADEFPFGTALSNTEPARDSAMVWLVSCVVTAVLDGCFYVESADRSCGIRIEKASHGVQAGDKVSITGVLRTNADGERYIEAFTITKTGVGSISPVHINAMALGGGNCFYDPSTGAGQCGVHMGFGLNNIGLLVRAWGRVTSKGTDWLYLDDGSLLNDGDPGVTQSNLGIRVVCDPSGYSSGDSVEVTGISSCFKTPADRIARRILTRGPGDVRKLDRP